MQRGAGPAGSPANGKQLPLPTLAQPPGRGPARPDAPPPSRRLGPGSGQAVEEGEAGKSRGKEVEREQRWGRGEGVKSER